MKGFTPTKSAERGKNELLKKKKRALEAAGNIGAAEGKTSAWGSEVTWKKGYIERHRKKWQEGGCDSP